MDKIEVDIWKQDPSWFEKYFKDIAWNCKTRQRVLHAISLEPGVTQHFLIPCTHDKDSTLWPEIQVVGIEISRESDHHHNYNSDIGILYKSAEKVFQAQPTRLFLHGFYLCDDELELWVFDRVRLYRSGIMYNVPFAQFQNDYMNMDDAQIGLNPMIFYTSNKSQYVVIKGKEVETHVEPRRSLAENSDGKIDLAYKLWLDKEPITRPQVIVSDGPTVYRATNDNGDEVIVKFSLRDESSRKEEKFMKRVTELNIWGVNQLIAQRRLETNKYLTACVVISPVGRPVTNYRSAFELIACIRDAIKAHRTLYFDAEIIHRDICPGNFMISKSPGANKGDPCGFLIDLDSGRDLRIPLQGPVHDMIGTKAFMAIDVARHEDDFILHTYRHDLESFFYCFMWLAIAKHGDVSPDSRIYLWNKDNSGCVRSANKKIEDISDRERFSAIVSEFTPAFKGTEELAYALRKILFFPDDDGFFFLGTKSGIEEVHKLYDAVIKTFDQAASRMT
ncbi:serine threonine- kinase sgk2 [Fusarium longipes]|uniref:Serine threonine-kinase sgk2 n=1 Tax=Fusarium longipes TaxID=694270 RepID=A0A395SM01_9HYPO|nr:serine threonine- kinase sgk2 [Fusarium longipes]